MLSPAVGRNTPNGLNLDHYYLNGMASKKPLWGGKQRGILFMAMRMVLTLGKSQGNSSRVTPRSRIDCHLLILHHVICGEEVNRSFSCYKLKLCVIFSGCHNRIVQTGWLKQLKCIFSPFWKLEV